MTMISGKLLGGTTRVNNGLYSRCAAAEFDGWGHGWEYEGLNKLYDKSEKKVENTKQSTPEGEWSTRIVPPFFKSSEMYPPSPSFSFLRPPPYAPSATETNLRFRQVIQETGVSYIKDINISPPSLPILTKLRTTVTKAGHRSSASEAFLPGTFLQRHKNLTICFDVVVQKIQISLLRGRKIVEGVFVGGENEGQGRAGKGVQGDRWFIRGGEVVLCAGAVGSAQLLILR
jgi:choline dehydrogenase